MKSLIKNIKSSDIREYSKKDFFTAFEYIKNGNTIKIESTKIKLLILSIIELTKKLKLDKKSPYLEKQIINKLSISENLYYIGIGEIVSEIIEGKKMICLSNLACQDTYKTEDFSNEINFVWDINKGWKVMKVSKNIEKILGYNRNDFINGNINFSEIIYGEDIERILKEVEKHSKNKDSSFIQEYRIIKKNGEVITVKDKTIVKFDKNGEIKYFYGYIYDITEQKEMEEYVKQHAFYDQKTGLPNEIQLQNDIKNTKGNKMIVLLKINAFKDINTSYGFSEGDKILLKIKDKLINEFGKLGFKIYKTAQLNFGLLKSCSENNPQESCENTKSEKELSVEEINKILNNFYIDSDYGKMHIKLSAGSACNETASFDNALQALYSGYNKGGLTQFNSELESKIKLESENKIKWSKKIREGLDKGYFIPHYQGIRDNKKGEINKYEALVRYDNGKDFFSPFHFLQIADDLNLLQDISKRMINVVIDEMTTHNLMISINLTEKDFLNEELIIFIEKKLNDNNIESNRLTIEVLENITEEGNITIIKNIKKLQKIGVKISIDDFGTGHSNFSRLLDVSPDFLKIDGSLIKGIIGQDSHKYGAILRSIIDFGHNQGAKLIAEYVENEEIQEKLDILGVDYSQGYYYSKPNREIIKTPLDL